MIPLYNVDVCSPGLADTLQTYYKALQREQYDVHKMSASKSCPSDPIPAHLLKQNISSLITDLVNVVNKSIATSKMRAYYKIAMVTPLFLKKCLLCMEFVYTKVLSRHRPCATSTVYVKIHSEGYTMISFQSVLRGICCSNPSNLHAEKNAGPRLP